MTESIKKTMSLPVSFAFTCKLSHSWIIRAKTKVVTNSPAPKIAPNDRKIPYEFPEDALKEESTSGAPLAKAKSVTPANVSLKWNFFAKLSKAGVK